MVHEASASASTSELSKYSPSASFLSSWQHYQTRCEKALENQLTSLAANKAVQTHSDLYDALLYASLDGGKRIRACLVYATGQMLGAENTSLDYPASAIELIHAYSLVHDDMPEMDNDTYRRGKLSTHAKYNQATALLVGDNLQTIAFELLSHPTLLGTIGAKSCLNMTQELARGSGIHGMIGGQAIDLALEHQLNDNNSINIDETLNTLETLHLMKTGALIRSAIFLGAHCASASPTTLDLLAEYAKHIGLLFQITDDILDETSSSEDLGKSAGKDKLLNKLTYTTLLGVTKAQEKAQYHCSMAKKSLETLDISFEISADFLYELADFILNRKK